MRSRWIIPLAFMFFLTFTALAQPYTCPLNVYFCDPVSGAALKPFLLRAINGAEKSIYIVAHKLTDQELVDALAQAVKRGVDVKVIVGEKAKVVKTSCIPWDKAADNVGKKVWVYGVVKSVHRTRYVFINIGNPYPKTPRFTIFIRNPFPFDAAFGRGFENNLKGQVVYVYGEISLYKGQPEIKPSSPDQLKSEALGTDIPKCTEEEESPSSILAKTGAAVRYFTKEGSLDQRFAVIDGHIVLAGSFDWTVESFTKDFVTFISTDCPDLAKAFEAQFNYLWEIFSSEG